MENKNVMIGGLAIIGAVLVYQLTRKSDSGRAKIRHVVLLHFTEKATPQAIAALNAGLKKMKSQVPEIISYTFGSDLKIVSGQADFAIVADFENEKDYKTYAASKPHVDLVTNLVKPMLKTRNAM